MTSTFVLRAQSVSTVDADSLVRLLQQAPGVQLLDQSARMLLVSGAQATVEQVVRGCDGWTVMPQTSVPLPDLRKKISGKPKG